MSIAPLITFKAGICDLDTSTSPPAVKPKPTPGYLYLYSEDDLIHFCWRSRNASLDEPELDLVMIPSDGSFTPYKPSGGNATNGRIFVLKFSSSSQRYLFWMQSRSQHENGDPSWFSPRDLKLGEIVDVFLQGEEVDVEHEIANLPSRPSGGDDDETMEDVEGTEHDPNRYSTGSGGAGPGATGGDVREEGQESREGGADGGRAATTGDSSASVVQDFLKSLGSGQSQSQDPERPSTTLQDLLPPSTTLQFIDSVDTTTADHLLSFLPPALLLLAQGNAEEASEADTDPELAQAALLSLDLSQKKDILRKVLRSPQFMQSLASLTVALRDGGLPSISEALQIPVANGGFMRRGGVPLGGGDAVDAFLDGVRRHVKEEDSEMDTD
ncbi:26S proteasome complex ubiquitin receptor subunit Rpn13 [Penicillium bovifimosum]|uniref:26S proteasome complex ubiquitin receptor subunit Rpn13 n=1 Tax=Penicillium bovifimosum TaxID=126998 RepID=A0A9W9H2Q2_9EURO|nr:26S proteasome complex ubiquitin receptor subunit Rpn13 [Penicillium bovifimosum]KAJ5135683.1 26S proteasome complex ubiquitin receptor subunit Rpn13 [Penicillium bovifimosum]